MNQERRIGLGLLATGVIGFLIVILVLVIAQARALTYTVVFEDAKGLQKGDKVQINGVDVGTVKSVKLISNEPPRVDVVVRVNSDQAAKVRSDSTAFISNVSLPNVSGQKVVEILNPKGEGAQPMKDGSQIIGVNSLIDLQIWKVKQGLGNAAENLSETIGEAAEAIKESAGPATQKLSEQGSKLTEALRAKTKEWSARLRDAGRQMKEGATSPEARTLYQQILEKIERFIALMREKGALAVDELMKQWANIKTEIGPMLEKLRALGQKYVVDTFNQTISEIDQALDKMRTPAPTPTPATPQPTPTPAA
ncbi:MAG: MlaD family protein [Candidatus Sumerlaeia bacterium]